MLLDIALFAVCAVTGAILWMPRLRTMPTWRAMTTPLASIIGSGFLILGPVLMAAYGAWAPAVMAGLCAAAWAFGAAVRANIARIGDHGDSRAAADRRIDALASAVLAAAYMISVAYYLNLFGAFAVSLTPWDAPVWARSVTTVVLLAICLTGWTRGFGMLERLEYGSVALKLSIIAALLIGLAVYFLGKASSGTLVVLETATRGTGALTLAMGLLVTVQGFETSRYLGATYDARTRIRSMRWSQEVSAVIYMSYILLMAFIFAREDLALSETAIVDMMAVVSPVLPLLLVAAALAAQFSAAVADTSGSGGLVAELSRGRLSNRQGYAILTFVALGLTWAADVFEIVTYASRAFAAYYAIQAALAARGAMRDGRRGMAAGYLLLTLFGAAIAVFGQPVEG